MGVLIREKDPGSGVWWVFVNHKGRRGSKKVGSREAAKAAAKKMQEQIALRKFNLQIPGEGGSVLFRVYAERWFKGHVKNNLKPASQQSYRGILDRYLLPRFAGKALSDITRADVKAFTHWMLEQGPGPSSVKVALIVASSVFNQAIEDGHLSANPAARIGKYLKVPDRRGRVEFLTPDEANLFLEAARATLPRHYPLFLTALRTGLRQGELIGLQWGDVDFAGGFIEVRRTNFNGYISSPKNGRIRRVDMSRGVAAALTAHRAVLASEALLVGRDRPEWVFPDESGEPMKAYVLRKRHELCLRKAGLRHVPFHALRHSFASALLGLGESPAYVKEQMGHHSIQLTIDHYGHLIPGANRGAVDRLDDLGKTPKSAPQAQPAEGATA